MDPYDDDPPSDDPYDDPYAAADADAPADPPSDDLIPNLLAAPADAPAPAASLAAANDPHAPERLSFDLLCIDCGYNLRGQLPNGSCPECGSPVARSNRSDQLSRANPAWVGSLRHGMNWILTGVLVGVGIFVISLIAGVILIGSQTSPGPMNFPLVFTLFGVVASIIHSVIITLGCWQLTQPEPGAFSDPATRSITRWTIVPAQGLAVIAAAMGASEMSSAVTASEVFNFIYLLLILVGLPCSLIYLRSLARRIPNPGLAKQTTIVFWGSLITAVAFIVGFVGLIVLAAAAFSSMGSGGGPSPLFGLVGLLMCPAGLAIVTFGIWYLVLLILYRGQFAAAHNAAQGMGRYGEPPRERHQANW